METEMKTKLETRRFAKKRKPTFLRTQTNQFKKFSNNLKWRRARGYQNKIRLSRKGHISKPTVGYGSAKEFRGANRLGLFEVRINNLDELKNTKLEKTQVFMIGRTVGSKKRLDLYSYAKENKITFSNVKDIDVEIKKLTKNTAKPATPKVKKVETKKEGDKK